MGCAILAHSAHVGIGHACASPALLLSFSIAAHSCIGLQPCSAEPAKTRRKEGQPLWTVVLHPSPQYAEHQDAMLAQASLQDQQQSQAETNSGRPMPSLPSRKASTPFKEHFQPDQLLLAWMQHQLKLSKGRHPDAAWPGAALQCPGSNTYVPLISGSVVAASYIPAQSAAPSITHQEQPQSQNPSIPLRSSVTCVAPETGTECHGVSGQLVFEVELLRGRPRAPCAQRQPASQTRPQAAAADQGPAGAFRPTPSGRKESSRSPGLEGFVEEEHIRSGQVEVKLGTVWARRDMAGSSLSEPDSQSADHVETLGHSSRLHLELW